MAKRLKAALRPQVRMLLLSSWRVWRRCGTRRLRLLIRVWGNPAYSAGSGFVGAVDRATHELRSGRVLECGSGLTTIVLALRARATGSFVATLEHDEAWCAEVQRRLRRAGLSPDIVRHAPLQDVGDADWYTLPDRLPTQFDLIVCDGPPGDTRGGRSGLGQLLPGRLADGGTILLDDVQRPHERELAERWASSVGTHPRFERDGTRKEYAVISGAANKPTTAQ